MRYKKEGLRAQEKRKVELKETVDLVEAPWRKNFTPLPSLSAERDPLPSSQKSPSRTMNIFRILGDVSHLLAIIILLAKIVKSKSCAGECTHAPGKEGSSVNGTTKWELERPVIAHTKWQRSPMGSLREVIIFIWEVSLTGEGCVGRM